MTNVRDTLVHRFGCEAGALWSEDETPAAWRTLSGHVSCRRFKPERLPLELMRTLSALALSSPSKSDLQQRDIVIVRDPAKREALNKLLAGQEWIASAPELIMFCGNNRRQRQWHDWRGHPFANDHLDAFFNAAVDAGIALSAFIVAAEARGLGTCPISAVRNVSQQVSDILSLPEHVFAVAGLGLGWPAEPVRTAVNLRMPLEATVHVDAYDDEATKASIAAYDHRRHALQPARSQRAPERFGHAEPYVWSEDKARQYATPERADFGAFVRRKGFNLT